MANYVVTFSGSAYHDTTRRIVEDSPRFGADAVYVYDDWWLQHHRPAYWAKTAYLRDRHNGKEGKARGVDWFLFKPYVLLDALRRVQPGDVVLYVDADTYPIAPLTPLFDHCRANGGVMLFNAVGCVQGQWTKRDVFVAMGCDAPVYHHAQHAVARFMLFQQGGTFQAERFIGEWLGYTSSPFINTFEPSVLGLPDLPGFRENRCEQSVLTNLAVRYGIRLYREACQFGATQPQDQELYPQTFYQDGRHSFDPGGCREGSRWRNVND